MGLSLVVADSGVCFKAVVIYNFLNGLSEADFVAKLIEVFNNDNLLHKTYAKTHVFWSFPESILVPADLMNADRNSNMLNLVFGDDKPGIIRSDFLYKHNLHNVFRTPVSVVDCFSTFLPVATQTHLFTALVNRDFPMGNHAYTVFYNSSLTIVLSKEKRLQVVQNFDYQDPGDCVFHLLHICKGFDTEPGTVTLHINGMIDKNSVLFEAIYKYFLHIEFDNLPGDFTYDDSIKNQPPHFFGHLFALASCV